jgi:N-formylglutamate amidohydrolase
MKYFKVINYNKNKFLLNIPHSSIKIPSKYIADYLISSKELMHEKKSMADLYTDELFSGLTKIDSITMTVSRILVDIERFTDKNLEPMSRVGMAAIYTSTQNGSRLRNLSKTKSRELLSDIYRPYHSKLDSLAQDKINKFNQCIIFDCHSFPSQPRRYEPDQNKDRPDICIGSDKFHTPKKLEKLLFDKFKAQGLSVKVNTPFAGSIVPNVFYNKNKKVVSVMIEINRKLYMDERTFKKKKGFNDIKNKITKVLGEAMGEMA